MTENLLVIVGGGIGLLPLDICYSTKQTGDKIETAGHQRSWDDLKGRK
ncbi:MAG: hypothetical protein ACR2QJ_11885 [Geminicoccaceae bacterium]